MTTYYRNVNVVTFVLMLCDCRLEIENARLEAAAKQQTNKIEALQKGVQDSAMVSLVNLHPNIFIPPVSFPYCLCIGMGKSTMFRYNVPC